jgi:hypothetical protein
MQAETPLWRADDGRTCPNGGRAAIRLNGAAIGSLWTTFESPTPKNVANHCRIGCKAPDEPSRQWEAGEQAMLVAEKTAPEQSSFWGAEAYRILRADTEIGRIDMQATRTRRGNGVDAKVRLRDHSFECRVDTTGRSWQQGIFSRWLMSAGDVVVHSAVFDGRMTYRICGDSRLHMRRKGYFRSTFVIVGEPDQAVVGDVHWIRGGHAGLDSSIELPESLAVFLLWIYVEIDYRASSSL